MKRAILPLMLLFLILPAFSQTDIDYGHKTLVKVLRKAEIQDLKTLKEMVLSGSTSSIPPINGKYFEIETENTRHYKYLYVGRVNSCRAGGCSISNNLSKDLSSEYFDYFMLFDKSLAVQYIKVFNYQATHGQEITARGWLKQFIGFDGNKEMTVGKNVDAISGATISVNGITDDISYKTELLRELTR
ncbi:MAG: FMN-binding protein [Bacteroidales bacterium]|nr:FMN-binding protein [Bacteroidales bacterium]